MDDTGTLSIALFSGTDDKLSAATLLATGAAALGRKVDILLQYWALDAFRAGEVTKDHGLTPEAGWEGAQAMRGLQEEGGGQHWSEVLAQAKQLGDVRVHACSLSMDMLGLTRTDLDPMVDDVEGVTAFMLAADGQLVFIQNRRWRPMTEITVDQVIDARGMACPGPLLSLIGAIRQAQVGDVLEVWSTDAGSATDIPAWVAKARQELLRVDDHGDHTRFAVRKAR